MSDKIFSKQEVNTGRQREFDYLKGIFMLFIYLIHAFQATASTSDAVASWIYMFATMSGAAIFIFVMGFGTVYGRNVTPTGFVKSGIRMVIYQYLNNIVYVAALLLPYPFVSGKLSENDMGSLKVILGIYIQYINIFFITGIIYFVLAFLIKLNTKTVGYALIGVAVSIAAPFIYGTPVNVPVVGYIMKLLIGEAAFVSFTPLYFLSYALFGIVFGKILRHVKDKGLFYRILTIPCTVLVIVWWVLAFKKYGSDISGMWDVMGVAYTTPNLWHVVASMAHILLFAAIIFFIDGIHKNNSDNSKPKNLVARQLLYYSSHISKYYAIHIIVYFVAYGFHGYIGFKSYQCWLLALLSILVTEFIVRGYNYCLDIRLKTTKKENR